MIASADFNDLKARVKAECLRRRYTGSVAEYGGSAYDYTVVPTAGGKILYEHYTKIADPLTAIDGIARTPRSRVNKSDMDEMTAAITELESYSLRSDETGCNASCTGLCLSTCTGSCAEGCVSACANSCQNDCTDICGECGASCSGGCTGYCTAACANNCDAICTAYCQEGCGATCAGDCYGSCDWQAS